MSFEIEEHGDAAIRLIAWRRDELNACSIQALAGSVEVVDAQEHPDPPGELPADCLLLLLAVRAMLVGVERPRASGELRTGISIPAGRTAEGLPVGL